MAMVALAALALAGGALAASGPVKGATYSGRLKPGHGVPLSDGTPIALKVASSGKKVSVQMETFPLFCEGGGPPQTIKFKPAAISDGKFTATGTETAGAEFGGGVTATATVTGKFVAGGKAKGSFEDKFTKAPSCNGKTTYTVKVAPQ
jgi:hypothetical protein